VSPPLTGVGLTRSVRVPSPSAPNSFGPQQYAIPCAVSPQNDRPRLSDANFTVPRTGVGVVMQGKGSIPVPVQISDDVPIVSP